MERLYLDHAATTPMRAEVLDAMLPFFTRLSANPSSMHTGGQHVARELAAARSKIAQALGAKSTEIIFTAGGSEADNLALFGSLSGRFERAHIVTSAIEHHAVLHAVEALRARGHRITVLPVDHEGLVSTGAVRQALDGTPAIVSIMHGNNEIGTIQDVTALASVAHEHGALFHTDAVQTVGHIPVDVDTFGVDLLSLSAHKFEGPKGIGALYVRSGLQLKPLIYGGGQEAGRRSGTENVPGVIGMATALALATTEQEQTTRRISALRDTLIDGIMHAIPQTSLNGSPTRRLPNNINVRFDHIEGDTVVLGLDIAGIEISTGSACSSGSLEPSHVTRALGLEPAQARGSVRMSLGRTTTHADVERVLQVLPPLVQRLRGLAGALTA